LLSSIGKAQHRMSVTKSPYYYPVMAPKEACIENA